MFINSSSLIGLNKSDSYVLKIPFQDTLLNSYAPSKALSKRGFVQSECSAFCHRRLPD
ncbi:hypothetical protein S7335_3103 [Synechococcus sp. PCC 7335]|nr:hypothetical protein S7335_3103 [Synechococcus sp. PCC 7335]